jgi:hypothetical protein
LLSLPFRKTHSEADSASNIRRALAKYLAIFKPKNIWIVVPEMVFVLG